MGLIRRCRYLAGDSLHAPGKRHIYATGAVKNRFFDRAPKSPLFRELLKEMLQVLVLRTAPTWLHNLVSSGWRFSLWFNLHVVSCRHWNRHPPRDRSRFEL